MQQVDKLPIVWPLLKRDTEPHSDVYNAARYQHSKCPGPDFLQQRGLTIAHF
jgi:hypothetical protein